MLRVGNNGDEGKSHNGNENVCVFFLEGVGWGIQLPVGVYSAETVYLNTVQLVANGI